jgi:membrane protein involved in colicin uptake
MATTIPIKKKKKQTEKQDSLALSIVIHLLLLMLILFSLMSAGEKKPKPPQFSGIQVALGTPLAEIKTQHKSSAAAPAEEKEVQPPKSQPTAKAQPAKAAPPKKSKAQPKKVVSETVREKAPIVAVKKKSKSRDKAVEKEKAENAAKAAKEKAEAEAEAAAAKKAAEEESKRQAAEEAAKKAAAKSAAKSKFNNIMQNTDAEQGAASKGNPLGHPDASALEGLSKGKGSAGDGLGNRSLLHAPEINDNTQEQGRVIINICVNKSGKVTSAEYTQRGSTTTDAHLISLATASAKKYRFSESQVEEQCGEVIIDFKLR